MEKAKYKNIFFEYKLSPIRSGKTIVILTGIPGAPKTYEFFDELVASGFNVVYPRYEGTWESTGNFLERPPAEAIDELLEYLHIEAVIDGQSDLTKEVFILGSSFGGYVALSLKDQYYIKKVCVMSPVVSYKQVNGIETLHDHIQGHFSDSYRYQESDWNKMLEDNLRSPINGMSLAPNKIMILAGKEDMQINVADLKDFSNKYNITHFKEVDARHITISRIDDEIKQAIIDFLKD